MTNSWSFGLSNVSSKPLFASKIFQGKILPVIFVSNNKKFELIGPLLEIFAQKNFGKFLTSLTCFKVFLPISKKTLKMTTKMTNDSLDKVI